MIVEFTIAWVVEPKQGGMTRIISSGGKHFARRYQPVKVKRNAETLALLMAPHRPAVPLDGPIRAHYEFKYGWLSSHGKKVRALGKLWKDTRPDTGNLAKNLEDVLERTGFVTNDARICAVRIEKYFCDSPGLFVRLTTIDEK